MQTASVTDFLERAKKFVEERGSEKREKPDGAMEDVYCAYAEYIKEVVPEKIVLVCRDTIDVKRDSGWFSLSVVVKMSDDSLRMKTIFEASSYIELKELTFENDELALRVRWCEFGYDGREEYRESRIRKSIDELTRKNDLL